MSELYFDQQGQFVIENYNDQKPFASFLPGIAGLKGIPLWVYYVNRGQGIASFGVENKNGSIMEFLPADKSYQLVSFNGFRTFIKLIEGDKTELLEPFSQSGAKKDSQERMLIKPHELSLEYLNESKALSVSVSTFTLPHENFAALAREITIENLSDKAIQMEVLDGLPGIIPYGIDNNAYKELGYTLQAWMHVYNLENQIPYYKVRSSTADSAEVSDITSGHFYLSFASDQEGTPLKPIVDIDLIFGSNTALAYPVSFMAHSIDELLKKEQIIVNKKPCGFSAVARALEPHAKIKIMSLIGNVSDISIIQSDLARIGTMQFFDKKHAEAHQLIESLTKTVETRTGSALFDGYVRQCYLDNVMRGGYPLLLENDKDPFVYHVYSRKHGDLERDYNFFSLAAEFYSQGNGNFRDANQNRRNDTLINPAIRGFNIKMFMNLIQTDGYNPLVVKGCTFILSPDGIAAVLAQFDPNDQDAVKTFFLKPYTPGRFLKLMQDKGLDSEIAQDRILTLALHHSTQNIEADYGEGYWSDHWTYNMDLVDSYLAVYPENVARLLFEDKSYRFYDSHVFVLPRKDKYVHVNGKVRQYHAKMEDEDKKELIDKRQQDRTWVRTQFGQGPVYKTNLFEKLLSLALIKFTSLDPLGMGVEMEGDKPGWNDSMNGLPGMFGSGMSETFEVKRIINFIMGLKNEQDLENRVISIHEELYELFTKTSSLLDIYNLSNDPQKDYQYWDSVTAGREAYREKTRYGLSGHQKNMGLNEIQTILQLLLKKLDQGINKAITFGQGLVPTYFTFEAEEWEFIKDQEGYIKTNHKGQQNVRILKFKPHCVNHYLEGPVKALKLMESASEAKLLYNRVKSSPLFDKKLKMYKTCAPLKDESMELGRGRAFTPGWLENESIFTHMEYKYILEVLKAGLYDEFFEDMKNVLIPFIDPKIYGRSTLENSSFIASSANPDPGTHGKGYVARLSGSTAEFLSMWFCMMVGKQPFAIKNDELTLSLSPIVPGWLFDKDGRLGFTFLGTTWVTYINPESKDTFGAGKAVLTRVVVQLKNNEIREFEGNTIPAPYAEKIRKGEAISITGYMQ